MSIRKSKPERPAPAAGEEFDNETEQDIESFLAGQSDAAVVSVYRIGKPGERDGFLDIMSLAAIMPTPEPVLRDSYGAGNYRLKLRAPNGKGVLQFAGSRTIVIADRAGAGRPGGVPAPAAGSTDEVARTHQLLLAMIANNKGPAPVDLGGMMTGMAALLTAVNGGNKQSDLNGIVQAFTTLKGAADPKDNLEQVTKVLDLARAINGGPAKSDGADDDASWPSLIRGAISAFTGGGRPPGPPQLQPAPIAGDQGDAGDEYDQGDDEGATMQQWLQGQLAFLKTKARAGKPVEFWIQYTIENADEVGNTALFGALRGGATFEHLLAFDPEIASNMMLRVWFQAFYDGLKRSISPSTVVPWVGRDISNAGGNANPGQDGQPTPGGAPGGLAPGQSSSG